jgi:hypothetical protein
MRPDQCSRRRRPCRRPDLRRLRRLRRLAHRLHLPPLRPRPAPYRYGICDRSALTDRVEELLGAPDTIAPQLRQLADALTNVNRPTSLIRWLDNSHTAQTLTDLARHGEPITHQNLDRLPQDSHLHRLRHILIRGGVLPDRDEYLARIHPWLHALLDAVPPSHADLVGRFASWELHQPNLRRRRSPGPTLTPSAGYHRRSDIRNILRFLDWLDHTEHSLSTLTQDDLDAWLADGPGTRTRIRRFLIWAQREGLAPALTVTQPQILTSTQPTPGEAALHHLDRCLHDDQIPPQHPRRRSTHPPLWTLAGATVRPHHRPRQPSRRRGTPHHRTRTHRPPTAPRDPYRQAGTAAPRPLADLPRSRRHNLAIPRQRSRPPSPALQPGQTPPTPRHRTRPRPHHRAQRPHCRTVQGRRLQPPRRQPTTPQGLPRRVTA